MSLASTTSRGGESHCWRRVFGQETERYGKRFRYEFIQKNKCTINHMGSVSRPNHALIFPAATVGLTLFSFSRFSQFHKLLEIFFHIGNSLPQPGAAVHYQALAVNVTRIGGRQIEHALRHLFSCGKSF